MATNNDPVLHFWTKNEADTFKHKLNGLSTTVEGLKIAVGVVGLGFTPFKFDASVLKGDEKGIVFLGRQLVTFPWAKDKDEREDRKLVRLAERAEKAGDKAVQARKDAEAIRSRVARGTSGRTGSGLGDNSAVTSAQRQADKATKNAEKLLAKARRHYVDTLKTAQKTRHEEKDAEKSKETAVKSLHSVRSNLRTTREHLRRLQEELAG
ncbi:hypothetical protein [Streptomyces sp. NPDC015131]|uniref:hypothetical protein n=1 Tax=Streptomyces sp. NPDC015131 TaxID=3364941 RepID=UPI003700F517